MLELHVRVVHRVIAFDWLVGCQNRTLSQQRVRDASRFRNCPLLVIHTAYFLYIHFQDFHRPVPAPNWAQLPFAGLVVLVTSLQAAAFIKTWLSRRDSRRLATP